MKPVALKHGETLSCQLKDQLADAAKTLASGQDTQSFTLSITAGDPSLYLSQRLKALLQTCSLFTDLYD